MEFVENSVLTNELHHRKFSFYISFSQMEMTLL